MQDLRHDSMATAVVGDHTAQRARPDVRAAASSDGMPAFLDGVPPDVRVQMARVVQESTDADSALAEVIALLLPGGLDRQVAVVEAFMSNESLAAQWRRAYAALKRSRIT